MAMDEEWVQVMMAKLWLLAFMDPGLEKWRLELLFEFFLFWQMYEQVFLARWMFAIHEKFASEWVVHVETWKVV